MSMGMGFEMKGVHVFPIFSLFSVLTFEDEGPPPLLQLLPCLSPMMDFYPSRILIQNKLLTWSWRFVTATEK